MHASYAHIMEVYNGSACDFNLRGVPSLKQRDMRIKYIDETAISVLSAAAFIAQTLGLKKLEREIMLLTNPVHK